LTGTVYQISFSPDQNQKLEKCPVSKPRLRIGGPLATISIGRRILTLFHLTAPPNWRESMRQVVFWAVARFIRRDETGATMVEYALMLAFIAAVCVGTVALVGTGTNIGFQSILGSF
jgi:Flp pilus assembly pilin Flp